MAWTNQPYCTRDDVKLMLDPNLNTTDDAFIDSLIVNAQADLDSEIGYSFQQDGTDTAPATRLYDGTGRTFLPVNDLLALYGGGGCTPTPCGAVFEITKTTYLSGNIWQTGGGQTFDITADIVLKPNNYVALGSPATKLVRNSGLDFLPGIQNYEVLGIFGQPVLSSQTYPGVPNDISRACMRLAVHYYKMRDTNYADMTQEQGGVRERYTKDWPADVKRVVAKYSHTRFITRTE